jgi:U3 small nucleolar RNA-associated protein 21
MASNRYQEGGAITAVSFRTDGLQMMASGNNTGSIAIWNLEEKSVHSVIHDAHGSAVTALKYVVIQARRNPISTLEPIEALDLTQTHTRFLGSLACRYLASQPVLLSAGACNSLKMWAFDQSDNGSRLLRLREGHSLPPTKARYYGVDGRFVLSAGKDRALRAFCLYSDSRSHEMSQGSLTKRAKHVGLAPEELKLPPITDFAAEEVREREWDNVVTTHARDGVARTWRWENKRLGSHKLEPKTHGGPPREAKSVAMSACGNFAIVGCV